jgi:ceramide glucosyltransferase
MRILSALLGLSALFLLASWAYWLVASACLRRFLRAAVPEPRPEILPPVSVLKPVKGADHEAYESFASFCRQDYPDYEVLFAAARADDPAVPLVETLIERLRRDDRAIRLLVTGEAGGNPAGNPAGNPKTALLERLAGEARGEVLVAADSDVRADPDALRRLVAPLANPAVGLVSALYRSRGGTTLAARLLGLYLDGSFIPSAVLAHRIAGRRFALGATMAFRRRDLERLGGYAAFRDRLLDDYEIGVRMAALGLQVRLSPAVVTHVLGAESFRGQWQRELRWNRGIRAVRPADYAGLLVTQTTPLALLVFLLALPAGLGGWGLAALLGTLALRAAVAYRAASDLGGRPPLSDLALLPLRDLFTTVAWAAGLAGRRITWRGARYLVRRDGGIERAAKS